MLLESDDYLVASAFSPFGGNACSYMVLSFVLPDVWGFLGGLLAGFFSRLKPSSQLRLPILLLMSPGMYVWAAYAAMSTPGRVENPWEGWPWAAILAVASLGGALTGNLIRASGGNVFTRRKSGDEEMTGT